MFLFVNVVLTVMSTSTNHCELDGFFASHDPLSRSNVAGFSFELRRCVKRERWRGTFEFENSR